MLTGARTSRRQAGFSMIEVLVTIIILAFGLLGLAGFQLRAQSTEMESYQRAQALVLLNDMIGRITLNRANAANYSTPATMPLGTGDNQPVSCTALVPGSFQRDQCEWSNALKGSAEASGGSNVGAMIGARGCITQIQAPNTAAGVCAPGIYQIDVAWQGLTATAVPSIACALNQYGNDANRRVVSARATFAVLGCS